MGTIYWRGTATAVAQVDTCQITAYDAATTYKLTVGGVVVSAVGNTSATQTASDLAAAWNASTHPYFTGVTAANNASDTVTLTADTAGVPFVATSSVTGGTGTIGAVTSSTACAGPNHWDTADNWSGGAVPVASDVVYLRDNDVNICWGLAQSAVDLAQLIIEQSYTGRIGLRENEFATSADGNTTNTAKPEYRATYLDIEVTRLEIGEHHTSGAPSGSGRIKLDLGVHECDAVIHNTARTPTDTGLPCVRLLVDKNTTDIFVWKAPGGVGVACDAGDETSTIREMTVSADNPQTYVYTSDGVTLTTWTQRGGTNVLSAAATVTTVTVDGGSLEVEGAFLCTTVNQNGGVVYANNVPAAGAAVTTYNLNGGSLDMKRSNRDRTITTLNWDKEAGATFSIDKNVVTLTNGIALA